MTRRWHRADDAISRHLPEGVLVMSLGAGDPIAVTGPGGALWERLDQPATIDDIVASLAHQYGTGEQTVRADVEPLLATLLARGLVAVDDEHADEVCDDGLDRSS